MYFLTYFPTDCIYFYLSLHEMCGFYGIISLACLCGLGRVSQVGNVFLWNTKQLPQYVGCKCLKFSLRFNVTGETAEVGVIQRGEIEGGKVNQTKYSAFVSVCSRQEGSKQQSMRELSRWRQKEGGKNKDEAGKLGGFA